MIELNELVFEVRFKPNPKVLDYRGSWAENLAVYMELNRWKVESNRIDLWDDNYKHHAFVSFKNAGYVIRESPNVKYFPDIVTKYFKYLFELQGFGDRIDVERIGLRLKKCVEYEKDFNDLVGKFNDRFMSLKKEAKESLNVEVIDIGCPLTLKDKNGQINFTTGPVKSNQIRDTLRINENFPDVKKIPEVAAFVDFDYSVGPKPKISAKDLSEFIHNLSYAAWEKTDTVIKIVLGS